MIIKIEDANIGHRNFRGLPTKFRDTSKTFSLFMSQEQGEELAKDGWNIKYTKPRDPDDDIKSFLSVKLNMNEDSRFFSKVVQITSNGKLVLNEKTVGNLDTAEIEKVDLIVRSREWKDDDGNERVKAYLKAMYVTLVEDELEEKYSDIPYRD
jgi:hypothetical protein